MGLVNCTYKTGSGQNAFTVETQITDWKIDFTIGAAEPTARVATAKFMQTRADYSRPVDNASLSLAGTTFYFADDTNFNSPRGPIIEWVRTYFTIPASYNDYDSFAYRYPGYEAQLAVSNGRWPLTYNVTSKLTYDFFLVGTGQAQATPDAIPVYFGLIFTYAEWTGFAPAEYLNSNSVPTKAAYQELVTTDTGTPTSYSIEATDSILERYHGNIWRRTRRFVKAR